MNAMTGPVREDNTVISVPASKYHLQTIAIILRELMKEAGFSARVTSAMELSIMEHCANVIKHGYCAIRSNITVNVALEPPIARVIVEDSMKEFDMIEKGMAGLSKKQGIRKIMEMCDYVEYRREGEINYNTFIVKDRYGGHAAS